MSRLKTTHRRKKRYAIGDLNQRITLHKRELAPPVHDSAAATESYATGTTVWASVNTPEFVGTGLQIFDKVNIPEGKSPSHKFVIRWQKFLNDGMTPITTQTIIRWQGDAYKILATRNPENRNEYYELFSKLMGDETKGANK